MNEQEMKALHRKIDAGVTAIAQAIEQHRRLGQLQFQPVSSGGIS